MIGRIQRENVRDLEEQIAAASRSVVLDLDEVTLVDVDVVRFLKDAEGAGVELRNCPAFIRTWIETERGAGR
ncbi:hypothetical protein [Anaeromyxobacter oryzae]|uniref:hypothetical protein n=1 Tax=Anaeromyxobacter oryzae TaxID=2918170 RepID=UPI0020BF609B|nr:hypothetical protein [Anaeromyxobacter oryzae]